MSIFIHRQLRGSQPVDSARVSIPSGLIPQFLIVPKRGTIFDLVSKKLAIKSLSGDNGSPSVGNGGESIYYNNGNNYVESVKGSPGFGEKDFAVGIVGDFVSAVGSFVAMSNDANQAGGSNQWRMQPNYNGSANSAGAFAFMTYGGSFINVGANTQFSTGEVCSFLGVRRGNVVELWKNGQLVATSSGTVQNVSGSEVQSVGFGWGTSYSTTAGGNRYLGYGIEGTIPPALAAKLSENPYSIFSPRESFIYFPDSAGGSISLSIADAIHGHASDAIDLSWLAALSVNDAAHSHAADNITLAATTGTSLTIADAAHGHVADGVALTTQWLLGIADAAHGHTADNVTIDTSNATWLTAQDAAHGHAADNAAISLSTWLAIVEAAHGHTAESPTLTAHVTLAIAEALHAMTADNVVLIDPSLITLVKDLRFAVRRLRTLAASRQRNFAVNRSRHVH